MPDGLLDQELEGIFFRFRKKVDLESLKNVSSAEQKNELEGILSANTPTSNSLYIKSREFSNAFIENKKIRLAMSQDKITQTAHKKTVKLSDGTKTEKTFFPFRVTKGVRDGNVRGGQFLKGKTRNEALENLLKEVDKDEPKQYRKEVE